ncbi:MAG TPA: imidazole glycerol phosphate synthase subunit HisF [Candidatus Hydrogenedentes bacterium]|nr:imidazole glycerol phosphate synthase subunit HisF [Candidatus Hydrogenedentota bacterium]HQE84515.1 imidazole glycerol phosphate synthase subunit HisF [Candidatus Hydrogenedentota bacterium]HQH54194.1 imidazole glycerol phosphate synthase subunit HisF [Candidatus Hydrogenedentota bacterium]HQM48118.1 imidazole glycerol phosphate synthase subunit HisF [Candidatus Hydrogenedentota bacterium]
MLTKRIIPCLDIRNRKVTKGVKFQNNLDLGDPIELAVAYSEGGADELVFYDITASAEERPIDLEMVREIGKVIHIPFAVGGGLHSIRDMYNVLDAGAEKVSVNSLAVKNPLIISEMAKALGRQNIVLGMDPVRAEDARSFPSGYEVTTRGFRECTGLDALEWARRAEDLGAGEIVVNSVDADGTRAGYELTLTRLIATNTSIPTVASGGAGTCQHIVDAFTKAHADAAIVASMVHTGEFTIAQIKEELLQAGIPIRKKW